MNFILVKENILEFITVSEPSQHTEIALGSAAVVHD